MAGLGLILLVLAGALAAAIAVNNTDATSVSAMGYSVTDLSTGELFLFGALTGLVFGLGLSMMIAGAARARARRRVLKSQTKAVRNERETLAEENARLQDELERERTTRVTPMADDDVYPVDGGRHVAEEQTTGRSGLFRR
jgi:uncharacterized integral membrane protein